MDRICRWIVVLGTLVTIGVTSGPAPAAQEAGGVAVTVTYKGKGPIDATHEVWVFLFDTPNLGEGARPLATQTLTKNGATATFANVATDPVYVVVAYDEKGDYDGYSGPPPAGTPIGIYSKDGKTMAPVKPGAAAKVKLTFDETRRR